MKNKQLLQGQPQTVSLLPGQTHTLVWPGRVAGQAYAEMPVALSLACATKSGAEPDATLEAEFDNKKNMVHQFECGTGDKLARFLVSEDHHLTLTVHAKNDPSVVEQAWRYAFLDQPVSVGYRWDGKGRQPEWVRGAPPATRPTACSERLKGGKWIISIDGVKESQYGWPIHLVEHVFTDGKVTRWFEGQVGKTSKSTVKETKNGCALDFFGQSQPIEFTGDDELRWGVGKDSFKMFRHWGPPSRDGRPPSAKPILSDVANDVYGGLVPGQSGGKPKPAEIWKTFRESTEMLGDVTPSMSIKDHIGKFVTSGAMPKVDVKGRPGRGGWSATIWPKNGAFFYTVDITADEFGWKVMRGTAFLLPND